MSEIDLARLERLERAVKRAWWDLAQAEQHGGVSVPEMERLYARYVQALNAYLPAKARYGRELLQQLRAEGQVSA